MLGLYVFFYACLHLSTWLVFDHFFDVHAIVKDIIKRPYITAGFLGFVLLIPLAVTSTNGWVKRLGSRWARLHRLVYVIATVGVLHYLWLVKADIRSPVIYGLILAVLFAYRAWIGRTAALPATRMVHQ
jgi:sulfoxide reductase heme-binding subunit YedZ